MSSGSSISSVGVCSSSRDSFVSNAAGAFQAKYNHEGNFTFAMVNDAGFLLGHEAISSNVSTLNPELLNVASLSRYPLLLLLLAIRPLICVCGKEPVLFSFRPYVCTDVYNFSHWHYCIANNSLCTV